MSPEVVNRKLAFITTYLKDIKPYEAISFEEFMRKHYEIERLIELLLISASDIIFHLISRGEPPLLQGRFFKAGEIGIISRELSKTRPWSGPGNIWSTNMPR